MDKRHGLWLLPLAVLCITAPAAAQIVFKESHRELAGGPDANDAERTMTERLNELSNLHGLQDQMQGLLNDPSFLGNLNQLSKPELQQLRDKLLNGTGLQQDPNWNRLLQQAQSSQKLDPQKIEMLRQWMERSNPKPSVSGTTGSVDSTGAPSSPTGLNPPSSAWPTPLAERGESTSWLDRLQEDGLKWFADNFDDAGGEMLNALLDAGGKGDNNPLADLLREAQRPDFDSAQWNERFSGLSQYLPNMGELLRERGGLWNDARSIFHDAHPSALPNLSLSKPASARGDSDAWIASLLSLLLLSAMGFAIYRLRARPANLRTTEEGAWRLGGWPTSPNGISTRADLVAAFEYLALSQLGISASTCHHRALAERLGEQDGDRRARRLAAETLAWLYEKARYAPAAETLSQDEWTDARLALCLLAGVTAP